MNKKLQKLSMLLISICLIVIFSNFSFPVSAAYYTSTSISLSLVGHKGYAPIHYFNESKMSQVKVKSSDQKYYNSNGELTDEFYIVDTNIKHVFGANSSATASILPYGDYLTLANANVLYASAKSGIYSKDKGSKNKVKISLSNGERETSIENAQFGSNKNGVYSPYYYETDSIKISSNENIVFSFKNKEESSIWSPADFKLFEPKICFNTIVDDINFDNVGGDIYHNGIVKLNATNDVLSITENSDLINYYKQQHTITYEIITGDEIANVLGNYLYFEGEESGIVEIRAKCRQSSNSEKYVYSDVVRYNYIANANQINVEQNFINSATISGTGKYYQGDTVTLIANANAGYELLYFEVDGQKIEDNIVSFTASTSNIIKLYCKKDISISNIEIKSKIYDGNTSAEINSITLEGVNASHELRVNGLQATFATSTAGEIKSVIVSGTPELVGDNKEFYNLKSFMPNVSGTITKKDISINFDANSKVYGDVDKSYTYNYEGLLDGEELDITLTREVGENVGNYEIFVQNNSLNYKVNVNNNVFKITPKLINLNYPIISKIYDGTTSIIVRPIITNIINGDDIAVDLHGDFVSKNVGINVINFSNVILTGEQKNNYYLTIDDLSTPTGEILKRTIEVNITSSTKVYGEDDPQYKYSTKNAVEEDDIQCSIIRDSGENVGIYTLTCSISNTNYHCVVSSSILEITPKSITVNADEKSKIYGDNDPILTFTTNGLVNEDFLRGELIREVGENVGEYKINKGSLNNSNYVIEFVSNTLTINARQSLLTLTFKDKIYDGTKNIESMKSFTNLVNNDNPSITFNCEFNDKNVGIDKTISVNNFVNNSQNYDIELKLEDWKANISRKNLIITCQSKTKLYGENDTDIEYQNDGLVDGDTVVGKLSRTAGENVGSYQITLGTITNDNNPNYNIILNSQVAYSITKLTIKVKVESVNKFYGDADPRTALILCDNCVLPFNEKLENIVIGNIARNEGEIPGVYLFNSGTIRSINTNYSVIFETGSNLIIKKLPITITALSATKVYGDSDPELWYEVSNPIFNDFEFALVRQSGQNVGQYLINYVSLNNDYFDIEYISNYLTISPRSITIKADEKVKMYGDQEPELTYTISQGMLVVGDKIENVTTGELSRQQGENVGTYTINKGSLTSNSNYDLSFVVNEFNIIKQTIVIKANNVEKSYSQADPLLTFDIVDGQLKFEDRISGFLSREEGEIVGDYTINIGTLAINNNYDIEFNEGIFSIIQKEIIITTPSYTKNYGDIDPVVNYNIIGEMKDEDILQGEIYRQIGENVGNYKYISTLTHDYYKISYQLGTLTINKRDIYIKAKSYIIDYKEEMPIYEYDIIGQILPQDTITGSIYKMPGEDVGIYEIKSTLNLGKNYDIHFTKGSVTILPLQIEIQSIDNTKTYGQKDKAIEYEVISGAIKEGDTLNGIIARQVGENVGYYAHLCQLENPNYNIVFNAGKTQITAKHVNLYTIAKDKVFDGTDYAEIRVPSVSGIIDNDVSLSYDINTCAKFENSNIGNNIKVILNNITLIGENSDNYILDYPILFANITKPVLQFKNVQVKSMSAVFTEDMSLVIKENDVEFEQEQFAKSVIQKLQLVAVEGNTVVDISGSVKVKIALNKNVSALQNIKVYQLNNEGKYVITKSTLKDNMLEIDANGLGNFVVVADSDVWINVSFILSVISVLFIATIFIFNNKKNKLKK